MSFFEFLRERLHLTKISQKLDNIMSAISDFATKQNAFNDKMDAAISDITTEVAALNSEIASLQASAGAITPEDQALLDGLQARAQSISDKLSALDTLQPPAVPASVGSSAS